MQKGLHEMATEMQKHMSISVGIRIPYQTSLTGPKKITRKGKSHRHSWTKRRGVSPKTFRQVAQAQEMESDFEKLTMGRLPAVNVSGFLQSELGQLPQPEFISRSGFVFSGVNDEPETEQERILKVMYGPGSRIGPESVSQYQYFYHEPTTRTLVPETETFEFFAPAARKGQALIPFRKMPTTMQRKYAKETKFQTYRPSREVAESRFRLRKLGVTQMPSSFQRVVQRKRGVVLL